MLELQTYESVNFKSREAGASEKVDPTFSGKSGVSCPTYRNIRYDKQCHNQYFEKTFSFS